MKKLITIMFLLGAGVFTVQAQNPRELDRVVMHEGKPILMHGNTSRLFQETITTEDGAKITTDGTYISPTGVSSKLKDGDIVYITGKRSTEKAPKAATKSTDKK